MTFDDQRVTAMYEAYSSASSVTCSNRSRQMQKAVADWHTVTLDCNWVVVYDFIFTDSECIETVIIDQIDHECSFLDDRVHVYAAKVKRARAALILH